MEYMYFLLLFVMILPGVLSHTETEQPAQYTGFGSYGFVFSLMKQVAQLEVTVANLQEQLDNKELKTDGDWMSEEISELRSEIEALKAEKERRRKPDVAVKVGLSENVKLVNGQRLVYDKVITNVGNAYDVKSGLFIAPVDAVYIFAVNSCSTVGNWDKMLIVQDGKEIGRVMSGESTNFNACSSDSTAAYVTTGSAVWVERQVGSSSGVQLFANGASFSATLVH